MRVLFKIFLIIFSISYTSLADIVFCQDSKLASLPILADGRVKPLAVHADEILKKIISHDCKLTGTQVYCALSLGLRNQLEELNQCKITFKVEHEKIKNILGVESNVLDTAIIENNIFNLRTELANEETNGRSESGYAVALGRLLTSRQVLMEIEKGTNWKVFTDKREWISVADIAGTANFHEVVLNQDSALEPSFLRKLKVESFYHQLQPFNIAIWLALIGFLISLIVNKSKFLFKVAFSFGISLVFIFVIGIGFRVFISDRAPVTNMYETVLWSALGILLLGLMLTWKKKESFYLMITLGSSLVLLFMMRFATGMLDSSIRPLVPVLRDNFWLSTHVTTITLAYACFALSWFIANALLIKRLFMEIPLARLVEINDSIRVIIQIGSILLSAGIILGGVWADYSWGRFWGWDPKETWSLIALLIYMAILHGKHAGWFKGIHFTIVNAVGFLFILMAWFGVNYILASGLHSYGFSQGGAVFLFSIFITQILIILIVLIKVGLFTNEFKNKVSN
jgi:ABC-type transport system involved in cytochrome c biogenesis permease subunit